MTPVQQLMGYGALVPNHPLVTRRPVLQVAGVKTIWSSNLLSQARRRFPEETHQIGNRPSISLRISLGSTSSSGISRGWARCDVAERVCCNQRSPFTS